MSKEKAADNRGKIYSANAVCGLVGLAVGVFTAYQYLKRNPSFVLDDYVQACVVINLEEIGDPRAPIVLDQKVESLIPVLIEQEEFEYGISNQLREWREVEYYDEPEQLAYVEERGVYPRIRTDFTSVRAEMLAEVSDSDYYGVLSSTEFLKEGCTERK